MTDRFLINHRIGALEFLLSFQPPQLYSRFPSHASNYISPQYTLESFCFGNVGFCYRERQLEIAISRI
jgi:hypothetical protein